MRIDNESSASDGAQRCPVTDLGREFNPFVDPYLADPYAFWLRARQAEPVFYSPELDYWVVTRYALMAGPSTTGAAAVPSGIDGDVLDDAYQALLSVGHGPQEARDRLDKALAGGKEYKTVEDVLLAIYQQK